MAKKSAADVPRAPVLKQRFNVYTMMLLVSFFALVTGCTVLWFYLDLYKPTPESKEWWWDTGAYKTLPQ